MLTDNGSMERDSCDLRKKEKQEDNFRDRCMSAPPQQNL